MKKEAHPLWAGLTRPGQGKRAEESIWHVGTKSKQWPSGGRSGA